MELHAGSTKDGQGSSGSLKPVWESFLLCQFKSSISVCQFYSRVKVTVLHLSSAFEIKFLVISFMQCVYGLSDVS